jgi:quercetin dioxygenase-like cupin family protein
MSKRTTSLWFPLSVLLAFTLSASARGEEAAKPTMLNAAGMTFVTVPGLPTCARVSPRSGDPTKGAFIVYAKVPTGCSIPWHWHTANETLLIVSGAAHMEMKGEKPMTLRLGGFTSLPSHQTHQLHCKQNCTFFIQSDGAFDIHYVDAQGKEIPAADALKPVKETAATEMK